VREAVEVVSPDPAQPMIDWVYNVPPAEPLSPPRWRQRSMSVRARRCIRPIAGWRCGIGCRGWRRCFDQGSGRRPTGACDRGAHLPDDHRLPDRATRDRAANRLL